MTVLSVPAGRTEHAGQSRRVLAGVRGGLQAMPNASLTTRPVGRRSAAAKMAGFGSTVGTGR